MAQQRTNAVIDFDTFLNIKTNNVREKKAGLNELTLENYLGKMIEERYDLAKALSKKKMTFKELLTFLNNK